MAERIISILKLLPNIFSASSISFLPSSIEARGAPPIPAKAAKAEMIRIIGRVTPTPVSAKSPYSGIFHIYILSTML